jgi:hypothetical protein
VTLGRYGHLLPGQDEAIADRLDATHTARKSPSNEPAAPLNCHSCDSSLTPTAGALPRADQQDGGYRSAAMRVRLVNQPARDLLGEELLERLRCSDTQRFWAASAWVRRPALRRLEPELRAFARRVKSSDCRGLFGVDLGGTTREGLELAAQLFGEARVFHSSGRPPRTFHPKLYLFEEPGLALLFIGSSNLTTGGLWGNFEAGTVIEMHLAEADDAALLDDVRSWYQRWWSDSNGSRRINPATIRALEADPAIRLPREHEVRKILAGPKRDGRSARSAFPRKVTGLKRIPKAPPDVDEVADRDEQPTVVLPGLALEEVETPAHPNDLRVLLAGVPHDRWKQIGFNREVSEHFFHVYVNGDALWIQGVEQSGALRSPRQAKLVFPKSSNQNHRIEFPEPDGRSDPRPDRAILVVLERSFRTFRYMSLRPGDAGYREVQRELASRAAFGAARMAETKRVCMSYGELKSVWPGVCPLRP